MRFTCTLENEHYDRRWLSEDATWELGFIPTIAGTHCLGLSPIEAEGPIRHYCCGNNKEFAEQVLTTLFIILEPYPTDATAREIDNDLPESFGSVQSNGCWEMLQDMAKITNWVAIQTKKPAEPAGLKISEGKSVYGH